MPKKIPLTRGKFALVDDVDYEWLSRFSWHFHPANGRDTEGYAVGYIPKHLRELSNGKGKIAMHRLLINVLPSLEVDHINHDGTDNRRANLRVVTRSEQTQNRRGAQRNSITGVRGVSRLRHADFYEAYVHVNRRKHYLGIFKNLDDAKMAAISGRKRLMTHAVEAE
tara:strand:- start:3006 stop:3506 length:501 start_codon:yes stop_codon:yes gene_type:complete